MDNASIKELLRKYSEEDGLEVSGDPDHDKTIKIGHVTIHIVECESCLYCRNCTQSSPITNSTEEEEQTVPNSEIVQIEDSEEEVESGDAPEIPTTSNSGLIKIPGILDEVENMTEESLLPDLSGADISAILGQDQDDNLIETPTENHLISTDSPASPVPSEPEPTVNIEPLSMDQSIESLQNLNIEIANVQDQTPVTPNVDVDESASNADAAATNTEICPSSQSRIPEFHSLEQLRQFNLQQEAASGIQGNAYGSFDNQPSGLWRSNTRPTRPLLPSPNRAFRPRQRYSSVYDPNPNPRPWSPHPFPPPLMGIPRYRNTSWERFQYYNYTHGPSSNMRGRGGYWR